MNDLNSIFIVGTVTRKPEAEARFIPRRKTGRLVVDILNKYSVFNSKIGWTEEKSVFSVIVSGRDVEKWKTLKRGTRIGINGRLDSVHAIVAHSIQILPSKGSK